MGFRRRADARLRRGLRRRHKRPGMRGSGRLETSCHSSDIIAWTRKNGRGSFAGIFGDTAPLETKTEGETHELPTLGLRMSGVTRWSQHHSAARHLTQYYEYSLCLRMHHPSMDPKVISRRLRMRPGISWRVGDERVTPTGRRLEGHRHDTYWSKTITPGGIKVPSGRTAEHKVAQLMKRLRPHAQILAEICNTGGRVELWISSYGVRNYSFIFPPELVASIHALGCELILDVYPYKQKWGR